MDSVDALGGKGDGLFLLVAPNREDIASQATAVLVRNGDRRSLGSVPIEQPEHTTTTVLGPVTDPLALDPLGPLPDHGEAAPTVDPFAVIEERLHSRLSAASRILGETGAVDYPYVAHECKELAEAIQRIAAIRQAEEALEPTPLLDADRIHQIGVEVWREANEAGASTHVADRCAAVVRDLLGRPG